MRRLPSHTERYIGTDAERRALRPSTDNPLPPGSSFLATDTGEMWRWDGGQWAQTTPDNEQLAVLEALLAEVTRLRELVELTIGA